MSALAHIAGEIGEDESGRRAGGEHGGGEAERLGMEVGKPHLNLQAGEMMQDHAGAGGADELGTLRNMTEHSFESISSLSDHDGGAGGGGEGGGAGRGKGRWGGGKGNDSSLDSGVGTSMLPNADTPWKGPELARGDLGSDGAGKSGTGTGTQQGGQGDAVSRLAQTELKVSMLMREMELIKAREHASGCVRLPPLCACVSLLVAELCLIVQGGLHRSRCACNRHPRRRAWARAGGGARRRR